MSNNIPGNNFEKDNGSYERTIKSYDALSHIDKSPAPKSNYDTHAYKSPSMPNQNSSGGGFLLGAIVGGLLGAATALLLAPKAGSQLRTDLNNQYSTVSQKASDVASTLGQKTSSAISAVGEKASTLSSQVGSKTQDYYTKAKDTAVNLTGEVKSRITGSSDTDTDTDTQTQNAAASDLVRDVKEAARNISNEASQAGMAVQDEVKTGAQTISDDAKKM